MSTEEVDCGTVVDYGHHFIDNRCSSGVEEQTKS
jgi:hypothetical protein